MTGHGADHPEWHYALCAELGPACRGLQKADPAWPTPISYDDMTRSSE